MHTVGYGPEAPRDLLHSIFCDNLHGNRRVRWQNRIALWKSRHQHDTANQLCVNKRFLTKKIFFFYLKIKHSGTCHPTPLCLWLARSPLWPLPELTGTTLGPGGDGKRGRRGSRRVGHLSQTLAGWPLTVRNSPREERPGQGVGEAGGRGFHALSQQVQGPPKALRVPPT